MTALSRTAPTLPLPDAPAMTPRQRGALNAKFAKERGLHAAPPGSGPDGETCGSCANLVRKRMSKTYLKCSLMESKWTGGAGTDVRAKDPAWSKREVA
jgi:hypothetical protein